MYVCVSVVSCRRCHRCRSLRLLSTSILTSVVRLKVVVIAMAAAVPEPLAPSSQLVPVPPLDQLTTAAVLSTCLLYTSDAADE